MPDGCYRASSILSLPIILPPWIPVEDGFPLKTCGNDRKGPCGNDRRDGLSLCYARGRLCHSPPHCPSDPPHCHSERSEESRISLPQAVRRGGLGQAGRERVFLPLTPALSRKGRGSSAASHAASSEWPLCWPWATDHRPRRGYRMTEGGLAGRTEGTVSFCHARQW